MNHSHLIGLGFAVMMLLTSCGKAPDTYIPVAPEHVLVVRGYSGDEYRPYANFVNVGDIHSCEPWLYSDCIRQNIETRLKQL